MHEDVPVNSRSVSQKFSPPEDGDRRSEAGLQRWLAIARDAGRNPETRAHGFASDLALAEEIEGEECLRVLSQPTLAGVDR